jgi:hypothetical protein
MTRPGSSIPNAEQREGPMLDTAEGLTKSPRCAAPCDATCGADAALAATEAKRARGRERFNHTSVTGTR